ncbi:MAG: alpha/beta fold hydrolase [Candidatus Nitronauta litoralis]|uniref:Alpha/beta fold hydrolase n=1 Tax=Candidatus Nitronauta litoralis TaxID=2705533 RepID=A0A7T0BYV0_9BACT|nr:MAG: alpha/beta fold hydrolase [Candidatus Nitronauta litoralis]
MLPFEPLPGLKNGVLQTILGSQISGDTLIGERIFHKIPLDTKNFILGLELPSKIPDAPLILLLHGMGGCSESAYIRRLARKMESRGFGVFMMNQSGSGPGMGLSSRLWHGGSSEDLSKMVEYIKVLYPGRPLILTGFSLSGNILLKYLGEGRQIPSEVQSALAVNPPVDLKAAALAISQGPWARTFNGYYMKLLNRQLKAIKECFPDAFVPEKTSRTIYDFDIAYTTPVGGFKDVDEYYQLSSSFQFLDNIFVPTTILCSKDDPFVPFDIFERTRMSLCVSTEFPDGGGHMGYISKKKLPTGDRRWMDYYVEQWALDAASGLNGNKSLSVRTEKTPGGESK